MTQLVGIDGLISVWQTGRLQIKIPMNTNVFPVYFPLDGTKKKGVCLVRPYATM